MNCLKALCPILEARSRAAFKFRVVAAARRSFLAIALGGSRGVLCQSSVSKDDAVTGDVTESSSRKTAFLFVAIVFVVVVLVVRGCDVEGRVVMAVFLAGCGGGIVVVVGFRASP